MLYLSIGSSMSEFVINGVLGFVYCLLPLLLAPQSDVKEAQTGNSFNCIHGNEQKVSGQNPLKGSVIKLARLPPTIFYNYQKFINFYQGYFFLINSIKTTYGKRNVPFRRSNTEIIYNNISCLIRGRMICYVKFKVQSRLPEGYYNFQELATFWGAVFGPERWNPILQLKYFYNQEECIFYAFFFKSQGASLSVTLFPL